MHRVPVVLIVLGLAACGGSPTQSASLGTGGDAGPDGGAAVSGLVAISLSQTDVRIPVGTMTAFAVTGTFDDGSRRDLSQEAGISSSDTRVATVAHGQGAQIQITAVGQGTATVAVRVGSFVQTCAVTVTR